MQNYALREMIKTAAINRPNLWKRWNERETVPAVVLSDIWEFGLKFLPEPPAHGLRLGSFLELLWKYYKSLPEGKERDDALYLFMDTVKSERLPYWKDKVKAKNGH